MAHSNRKKYGPPPPEQMRPFQLRGHTRPVEQVMFNKEGDLLFSCAAGAKPPCLWRTSNGERLGTFNGHGGTVFDCDVSDDSKYFLTGAADQTARVWEVKTGKPILSLPHESNVRTVDFALGDRMILTAQDTAYKARPTIFLWKFDPENLPEEPTPFATMFQPEDEAKTKPMGRINTALWGPLNETVYGACHDGSIRVWDVKTQEQVKKIQAFDQTIQEMQLSPDGEMLIVSCPDEYSCKVFDTRTLELLREIRSNRPVRTACMHPEFNQIWLAGGQEALKVATDDSGAGGRFETMIYHSIFDTFLGSIKGHFGTVNTLVIGPQGKMFATGGHDGYVRLQHLPQNYFKASQKYDWQTQ